MLEKEKIESIRRIGSKMIYFELFIMFLAIFTVSYFEGLKMFASMIMLLAVIFILFSRISVLFARQKALLRYIENSNNNGC